MAIPVELDETLEAGRGFDSKGGFARRILLGAFGLDDGAVPVPVVTEAVAGRVEAEQAVRAVPAAPVTSPVAARDEAREKAGLPPAPRFNVTASKWSS